MVVSSDSVLQILRKNPLVKIAIFVPFDGKSELVSSDPVSHILSAVFSLVDSDAMTRTSREVPIVLRVSYFLLPKPVIVAKVKESSVVVSLVERLNGTEIRNLPKRKIALGE